MKIDTDTPTPKTDAACEEAAKLAWAVAGIPAMYGYMVEHAREMERLAYAYRAVAAAGLKIERTR